MIEAAPALRPAVRHVAIAGGGIGGLTLACALQRQGIAATVFEKAPELRPVGAGITVQANAIVALRSIGLDQAVAAQGVAAGESAILDASGRTLQALRMDVVAERLGAPFVCLHRARLHRVLLDARILERTDEAEILRTDIRDRPPVRSWSKGRVVLLGDAAHPMTPNLGQGGCQAIEDAVVLARALATMPSVEAALRRYEALRIPRANEIVQRSYGMGRVAQWENRAAIRLRNLLVRLTPAAVAHRQLERAMRFEPAP